MSNNDNRTNESQDKRPRGGRIGRGNMPVESPKNFSKTIKRLFSYFKDKKLTLFFISVFVVITTLLRIIMPAFIGISIRDYLEVNVDLAGFGRQMIILIFILLGTWIFGALQGVIMTRLVNLTIFKIRNDTFTNIQTLSMSYFDKKGLGDVISRLTNDIERIENFMSSGVVSLISSLFSIIGYLIMMIALNPLLSLTILLLVPIMVLFTLFIAKRVREAFRKNQAQIGKLSSNIQESVSCVRVIKTFAREKEEFNKFEKINNNARLIGEKAETLSFSFMPIMTMMTAFMLAAIVGFGGTMAFNGMISVGLLMSFIMYSRRFFEPLRQLTNVYNLMQSALAGAERIFLILDAKSEITNATKPILLTQVKGNVEFNNVRFGYEKDKVVLDGINIKADKGEVIALVGPTGAGKTTIINLLSRFYDVWDGNITLDGNDIREIELNSLRTQMGVVLQEPFFFSKSIRENLLYGKPSATEEELIRASKLANADNFIKRMPHSYDTVLTERGMNISQGERQLLAIARAILADPKILILDEATSNIDSLTETHIQEGLLELMKGRTSFIIAHRLSTIKNADKVLVIHNHKIIEEGTHDELIEKGGFYSRLYKLQLHKDMQDVTEDMEI